MMEHFKNENNNMANLSERERKLQLEKIFNEFMGKVRDSGDEAKTVDEQKPD